MNHSRPDLLIRTWLEGLALSRNLKLAELAAEALRLDYQLRHGGLAREALAMRYVAVVEQILVVANAARTSTWELRSEDPRASGPPNHGVPSDLNRFWSDALASLKRHLESN